jgi:cell division protein FtsB
MRTTKLALEQLNQRLAAENHELRRQIGDLRLQAARETVQATYPLTDKLGRSYRLEKGIRCYPAEQ